MKKYFAAAILVGFCLFRSFGQETPAWITKEKQVLANAGSDTARIRLLLRVGGGYRFSNIDSALYFDDQAIALARKVSATMLEARALNDKGSLILDSGDIPRAYSYMFQSLTIIGKVPKVDYNSIFITAAILNRLGNLFMELGEYNTSIQYYRESFSYAARCHSAIVYNEWSNIGNDFELEGQLDSAQFYQYRGYNYIDSVVARGYKANFFIYAELEGRLANIERDLGHYQAALDWYRKGAQQAIQTSDMRNLSELSLRAGQVFGKLRQTDSAFFYGRKALQVSRSIYKKSTEYQAASLLSDLFKATGKPDSALFFLSLSQKVKDDLYGPAIFRQLQQMALHQQQQQQQLQEQNNELKYRYAIIAVVAGLFIIGLVAFFIWRNYRRQKSTNLLLHEQKEEIASQRDHLGMTLEKLKTTQNQLIQSEKMASLGELTAGIAHEIQNPLNFVNNFSEVNEEILDELKAETQKPKAERDEQLETELINGLIENHGKIKHHGKRADFIVKGMLEHSRSSKGEKQLTDLNMVCDEFMKLSYYGLNAKDKNFKAVPIAIGMITHFGENLPKANVSQQDMGRVMLNLFNNAFYAVNEKKKTAGSDYKPEVSVTTGLENGNAIIKIKDNGNGIPDAIKDKIMQPFFTTKPTGEGTGLGLSLSYDIVVKGHGGKIDLVSKEQEYTEFTIIIPF